MPWSVDSGRCSSTAPSTTRYHHSLVALCPVSTTVVHILFHHDRPRRRHETKDALAIISLKIYNRADQLVANWRPWSRSEWWDLLHVAAGPWLRTGALGRREPGRSLSGGLQDCSAAAYGALTKQELEFVFTFHYMLPGEFVRAFGAVWYSCFTLPCTCLANTDVL